MYGCCLPSCCMKTTIEIPDVLLRRLRERAARQGTTLKALVHAAIQEFLAGPRGESGGTRFRLRDGSFGGDGPAPGVTEGDWRTTLDLIYEGRGGVGDGGAGRVAKGPEGLGPGQARGGGGAAAQQR